MSALAWATPVIVVVTIVGLCQLGHALRHWPPWWLTRHRVRKQQQAELQAVADARVQRMRNKWILHSIQARQVTAAEAVAAAQRNHEHWMAGQRARRDQEWAHLRNTCHIPDEPWWTDFTQGHEETTR